MSLTIKMTLRGVLVAGKWRNETDLENMSDEDCRNTVIVELSGRSKLPQSNGHIIHNYYQRFNNDELVGKAAVVIYLQESGIRNLATLKTMSDADQRTTLIEENYKHTGLPILQGLTNQQLVRLALVE
jgi:hypothetical protein